MSKAIDSLLSRASQSHQAGKILQARVQYQKILQQAPRHVVALHLLGVTHLQTNEPEKGLGFIDQALALQPRFAEALSNRAAALKSLQRYEESVEACRMALALKPDYPDALNNLGASLHELRRYSEAVEAYKQLLAIQPNHADALSNLGSALKVLRRYPEAEAAYRRALELRPAFPEAHHNLGATLEEMNRHAEALESYERALAIDPGNIEAAWSRGLLFLNHGRFEEGWKMYERRWERRKTRPLAPTPWPLWLGKEPLEGKRLFIQFEQGFGDLMQMARYLSLLVEQEAQCTLQVPKALHALIARSFPSVRLLGLEEIPAEADFRIPFMSFPLAFGTIPARVPYLLPDSEKAARWGARLGEGYSRRIGLAWRGNREHANDHNRSARLEDFLPILAHADIQWVVLQKDLTAQEFSFLRSYGNAAILDAELTDFDETAAVISLLDEVVSIDSALAHLSGALGRPVSILLPFSGDWRWMIGREETPWYPTARLFRQTAPGNWNPPIQRVVAFL